MNGAGRIVIGLVWDMGRLARVRIEETVHQTVWGALTCFDLEILSHC